MILRNKFLVAFLGVALSAVSVEDSSDQFEAVVWSLLSSDPAVRAERARLQSEIEQLRADNSLAAPELGFGYKWGQGSTEINKWEISVSQSFDWPGVYGVRRKAIRDRRQAADASLKAYRQARECEIRTLLIDYVAARRRFELHDAFSRNVDSLYNVSEKAYALRQMTVLDFRKVRVERELARARVLDASAEMHSAADRLTALNGGTALDLSGIDSYPTADVGGFDPLSSPSLSAARWNVLASEAAAETARRSLFPGFSIGYVHEVEGGEHFNGLSVGLTLPVWKGRKESVAAKLLAEAAAESVENMRREIEGEFVANQEKYLSLIEQAESLRSTVEDGDGYRVLLDKALAGGTITLYEYFGELNNILEVRLAVEDLRAGAARTAEQIRKYR